MANRTSKPRAANGRSAKFRVGDNVTVTLANSRAKARILEDRGLLGADGGRIFRIQITEPDMDVAFEVPAEKLRPA